MWYGLKGINIITAHMTSCLYPNKLCITQRTHDSSSAVFKTLKTEFFWQTNQLLLIKNELFLFLSSK